MGSQFRTIARASSLLTLLGIILAAGPARAQVVSNPTAVMFTASEDHDAVLPDGRAAIDSYRFDMYLLGANQPFQGTALGKPDPAGDGTITYDFSGDLPAWPLPGGTYEARVAAVGPNGVGVSPPSNPFTFSRSCSYTLSGGSASLPAAGGGTQVGVSTGSGCPWTAESDVAWIALGPASGSGDGTVIATVDANTSNRTRTSTLTVAGQAFTISQAGRRGRK